MDKKYELTDETIDIGCRILYRIRALRSFSNIKAGELGGYVESKNNLDHAGNCWVGGNARVYENAWLCDNCLVFENACVYGNTWVGRDARIYGNARVFGNVWVCGHSTVCEDAWVFGTARVFDDARVSGNTWVLGTSNIGKNIKLESGVWNQQIFLKDKYYLISTTLKKVSLIW